MSHLLQIHLSIVHKCIPVILKWCKAKSKIIHKLNPRQGEEQGGHLKLHTNDGISFLS